MISADDMPLLVSIRKHEGFRAHLYTDTTGNLTIGYGTNVTAGFSRSMAEALLRVQVTDVYDWLVKGYHWFEGLTDPRQRALVEMAYQLGPGGFAGFKKMIAALEAGDPNEAASQMRDSRWREQTPPRCDELALRMEEG